MLKAFCQNCGSPTEYSLTPPLFCSQCSKPLKSLSGSVVQASNSIKKLQKPRQNIVFDNEEDEDDYYHSSPVHVPRLDQLDVEIDLSDSRGLKIGQIAASAQVQVVDKKVEIPSKKQLLADFQKQASALKGKESSEIS